ncbi:hypothetical protein FXB41_39050 [Bradyrhizobium canariense]|uniref:metallophosphoesterase n=1 Tax=Bradyrhizobium canariense TaxID=255045 RepID=UPI001CA57B5B|nr:metallophosphoesterase [Bradyrhizobium canariense]MBW5440553.1 hypothetical protein [Bradyrhizobium canariense]
MIGHNKTQHGTFSWLHLTDLHVGMKDQDWMWPRLKELFYNDLTLLHRTSGDWNVVVFSGDLTQRGSPEEFNRLDSIVTDLWSHFEKLGFRPKLLVIPGNHDVSRPTMSSQYRTLKRWWDDAEVQAEFFASTDNEYRQAISGTFAPYSAWLERFTRANDFLLRGTDGILAGDQSIMLDINGVKVGFVGLNSTWLQIDGADYQGELHVDVRQLLAVTGGDPGAWTKQNELNLLVYHHPTDWLHSKSLLSWNSEIAPPGRFDVDLFGHMHEPSSVSTSFAGSRARVLLQGASTCGLRYIAGNHSIERIHGYCLVSYQNLERKRSLKAWPRRLYPLQDGSSRFNPDVSFPLEQDNAYVIPLADLHADSDAIQIIAEDPSLASIPRQQLKETLQEILFHFPHQSSHANVRRVEQRRLVEGLAEEQACWIASEWGMGSDGFLAAAIKHLPSSRFQITYRLDLSDYVSRLGFFDSIVRQLNCTFERLCQMLAEVGECGLVLDDVPSDQERVVEIEGIVSVLLEYCPQLNIVLRSRIGPIGARLPHVHLSALDKADLAAYISDHELGDDAYLSAEAVHRLHMHTDGVPARVDRALKELQVVSLSDLVNSDAEVSRDLVAAEIPETLASVILRLASSEDESASRAFGLLKVLSLFPQGESLARIKHFYSAKPFFPPHATALKDQGLLESVTVQHLNTSGEDSSPRILIVPRLVREAVRQALSVDDAFFLDRRAAELYFGADWSSGSYRPPPAYRFNNPHCNTSDLANANVIIMRLYRESVTASDGEMTERVLGLMVSHLTALFKGDHYQSIVTFCEDVLAIVNPDDHQEKAALIKHTYARALRMCGYHEKSKQVIEEIRDFDFSSDKKESLLLNLALVYQAMRDREEAEKVAKEILRLDRNSFSALQAKSILLEYQRDDPKQEEKLAQLEAICRKRNAIVVANNIALHRAQKQHDPLRITEILRPVLASKGNKEDYYNKARAVIEMAENSLRQGDRLTQRELSNLITVYHFVYNERFPKLLDRAHDVLWAAFREKNDKANLLLLFRHSSLHWRLQGLDQTEATYLEKLAAIVGDTVSKRVVSLSKEVAYYLVRVSHLLVGRVAEERQSDTLSTGPTRTK